MGAPCARRKPFFKNRRAPGYFFPPNSDRAMSNGARVNREYPMVEKVPGESSDHPHHQSLFFTYDEVNGTNFWNPERTGRRIQQRARHWQVQHQVQRLGRLASHRFRQCRPHHPGVPAARLPRGHRSRWRGRPRSG